MHISLSSHGILFLGKKTVTRKTKIQDRTIDLHQKLIMNICEVWAKISHELGLISTVKYTKK